MFNDKENYYKTITTTTTAAAAAAAAAATTTTTTTTTTGITIENPTRKDYVHYEITYMNALETILAESKKE